MEEPHNTHILAELAAIRESLAVNTTKTGRIESDIGEIKTDLKAIREDYPSRREFTDALTVIRGDISFFKKIVYSIVSFLALGIGTALFKLIFK